jgi:uncharacterized protein DUF6600/FecR-like protein
MKTRKQWLAWAVVLTIFAFMLQAPLNALAQNRNQSQDQNRNTDQNRNQDQNQSAQDQSQAVQDQSQAVQDRSQPAQDQSQVQGQAQDQNEQDPPGRVARLNYSEGSVSFQPGGENDWVTAVPNRPMVTGDNLWADENSRAEAHIGSTAIRLGPKTGTTFLEITDRTTQIRLAQGSLIMRVRHVDDEDTYEVDTPNLSFALLQPGEYRIDVSEDGKQTVTTVWHGRGEVTGAGFSYTVVAGQSATFTGTDHLDYDLGQIPQSDSFDRWAFDRDDREDRADSANYVSRETTGYEDLDEYGDWSYVAGYGPCWRPRAVVVGWAPYRFGHWVWIAPWGWTWVEDEPWGFAPFHYGRWALVTGGWFWVPGPVVVRPIWAPAFVAFVGGGAGFQFSVGIGGGAVGWFPLAPGEVFVPGYRVSRTYVNNVNITNTTVNVTKVTNVYNTVIVNNNTNVNRITYVNQHVNGGVTVVPREAFVNAKPVAKNIVQVPQREIEAAAVTHRVAIEPSRASVLGPGRPASVKPPAVVMSRPVVARRAPAAQPQSFAVRQSQAGGHMNEPVARPGAQPQRPNQPNQTARPAQSQEGFRPFTPPNRESAQPQNRASTPPQPENRGNERPIPQGWSHPLARPAPPVQEKSPQQQREDESKFRSWQQQRPAQPPARQSPSPRQERPSSKPEKH